MTNGYTTGTIHCFLYFAFAFSFLPFLLLPSSSDSDSSSTGEDDSSDSDDSKDSDSSFSGSEVSSYESSDEEDADYNPDDHYLDEVAERSPTRTTPTSEKKKASEKDKNFPEALETGFERMGAPKIDTPFDREIAALVEESLEDSRRMPRPKNLLAEVRLEGGGGGGGGAGGAPPTTGTGPNGAVPFRLLQRKTAPGGTSTLGGLDGGGGGPKQGASVLAPSAANLPRIMVPKRSDIAQNAMIVGAARAMVDGRGGLFSGGGGAKAAEEERERAELKRRTLEAAQSQSIEDVGGPSNPFLPEDHLGGRGTKTNEEDDGAPKPSKISGNVVFKPPKRNQDSSSSRNKGKDGKSYGGNKGKEGKLEGKEGWSSPEAARGGHGPAGVVEQLTAGGLVDSRGNKGGLLQSPGGGAAQSKPPGGKGGPKEHDVVETSVATKGNKGGTKKGAAKNRFNDHSSDEEGGGITPVEGKKGGGKASSTEGQGGKAKGSSKKGGKAGKKGQGGKGGKGSY